MKLSHDLIIILFTIFLLDQVMSGFVPKEMESITNEEETNIIEQEAAESGDWIQSVPLPLTDKDGWYHSKYSSSIRVLTVDEKIWLFIRGYFGMQVFNYDHTTESWNYFPTLPDLNDPNKWGESVSYYSTIRVIAYENGFWLLARNADGLQLYQFDVLSSTWSKKQSVQALSDANGWDKPEYYSTIRALSYLGKIWLFVRASEGEVIYQYDYQTETWSPPSLGFPELGDGHHWNDGPKYYSTIQIVRIEANFWLLARGRYGMYVFQYDSTNDKWTRKASLSDLADINGWEQKVYYSSIQAVFLESEKRFIWLFARNQFGMQTYRYDTERDLWASKPSLTNLSEANGWSTSEHFSIIQAVVLNTSIALAARGHDGLEYYEYTPANDTWNSISTLDVLSDVNGWNNENYYSSIRAINYQDQLSVLARGPDGMRVYDYRGKSMLESEGSGGSEEVANSNVEIEVEVEIEIEQQEPIAVVAAQVKESDAEEQEPLAVEDVEVKIEIEEEEQEPIVVAEATVEETEAEEQEPIIIEEIKVEEIEEEEQKFIVIEAEIEEISEEQQEPISVEEVGIAVEVKIEEEEQEPIVVIEAKVEEIEAEEQEPLAVEEVEVKIEIKEEEEEPIVVVVEVETELNQSEMSTLEAEELEESKEVEGSRETEESEQSQLSHWNQGPALPNLDDVHGWDDVKYYSTIRVLILNQQIWLFARGKGGILVYNYDSNTKSWSLLSTLSDLGDSNNWGAGPEYYSTIQVVAFFSNVWLLARNANGLQVYQYDPLSSTWTHRQALASLSDDNGWNSEKYYSTIEAFAIDGDIWVFARGRNGEEVHKYDTEMDDWNWDDSPSLYAFSDYNSWGRDPKYYSTIQVVRLGRDFWLLGRDSGGMRLYQFTANDWIEKTSLPQLSDQEGWGDPEYYSTIQAVVLETSIWLFARKEFGIQTYQYDVTKDSWTPKQSLPALSDENNWDRVEYYSTIQVISLNTSIALLARGPNGLEYYEYTPVTDTWKSISTITSLSDENKWYRREYYSTIQGIKYRETVNVIARGPSGVRVYEYVE